MLKAELTVYAPATKCLAQVELSFADTLLDITEPQADDINHSGH